MNRVLYFPVLESPFMLGNQRAQLASMVAIGKNVGVITISIRDVSELDVDLLNGIRPRPQTARFHDSESFHTRSLQWILDWHSGRQFGC